MLLLLLACAPPLLEGPYLVTVPAQQNSCGWDDESWGVGTEIEYQLSWPASDTIWLELDGGVLEYHYEGGDSFSGDGSFDQEVESPCFLHFDILDEGIINGPRFFQIREFVNLDVQGDCSAYDTSNLPCDAQLQLVGKMQDDGTSVP